jgi:hypothetical protein
MRDGAPRVESGATAAAVSRAAGSAANRSMSAGTTITTPRPRMYTPAPHRASRARARPACAICIARPAGVNPRLRRAA